MLYRSSDFFCKDNGNLRKLLREFMNGVFDFVKCVFSFVNGLKQRENTVRIGITRENASNYFYFFCVICNESKLTLIQLG